VTQLYYKEVVPRYTSGKWLTLTSILAS